MPRRFIVLLILIIGSGVFTNANANAKNSVVNGSPVKIMPLDFNLRHKLPSASTPWYGWQLFSWKNWITRPSSGPLLMPIADGHLPMSVFQASFAAILQQPISLFTKNYLHSMATIQKLDPNDLHEQVQLKDPNGVKPPFVVQTVVRFPNAWARLIRIGKLAKILSSKSSDHLIMTSVFGYISKDQILTNPKIQQIIRRLDVTGRTPYAINTQGIVNINEIGEFGSMITFFYPLGAHETLLVSDFALGVKNKILNLGFHVGSLNFTGEGVLLGDNPVLNTSTGIGAGLPAYTEELFLDMWRGLN